MKPKEQKKLSDEDLRAIDLLCRKSLKKFLQSLPPEKLKELFTSSKYTTEEPLPKHLRLEYLVANQYQQRCKIDAKKNRNLKVSASAMVASNNISKPAGVKAGPKKRVQLSVKSGGIPSKKLVGSYRCEWPGCTKLRDSRESVMRHMNIHLQAFKCSVCSKCFECPADLRRHYTCHDSLRPFVCNICSNAYKEKRDLKRHALKVHSGLPPPYACPDCVYSSWNWAHLCGHRVNVHHWHWSNQDADDT